MIDKRERPFLRKAANGLTDSRYYGSFALAGEIALKGNSFRSWRIAGRAAVLMATDALDGWLGRRSNIPSTEYTKKDESRDKSFYRNVMTAMTVSTGDKRYLAYSGVNDIRNGLVEGARVKLRESGLSAAARPLGKVKTGLQNLGILLDLSPIGDNHPSLAHVLHTGAVCLSAISGADVIINANQQLADRAPELIEPPDPLGP